jgi:hypothetical protein
MFLGSGLLSHLIAIFEASRYSIFRDMAMLKLYIQPAYTFTPAWLTLRVVAEVLWNTNQHRGYLRADGFKGRTIDKLDYVSKDLEAHASRNVVQY